MNLKTKTSQIDLTFERLTMTLRHPFGISYGTSATTDNVLVKLRYGDLIGLGEASPASYHSESLETVNAVLSMIKANQSEILGDDPFAVQMVTKRMDKLIAGNQSAKAAIEMAMHDLAGKVLGVPVYKMLGLSGHPQPMTDYTIGIDDLYMIERKTREAVGEGYKMLKVKLGTTYDEKIIDKVRSNAGDLPIIVDANGGWNVKRACHMAGFLQDYKVELIEQPLPKNTSVSDFRFVKENSPIPIYADESICVSSDVAKMAPGIDGVVVKLAKTGGILEAMRLIGVARAHGLGVMFGMMIESSIGVTASCQLQSLCDYLDLDGALLLKDDPYQGAQYKDGYLMLSDLPGLGVTLRSS